MCASVCLSACHLPSAHLCFCLCACACLFPACKNCIELDPAAAAGMAIGNLVATVMIGVAVYHIASQSRGTRATVQQGERSCQKPGRDPVKICFSREVVRGSILVLKGSFQAHICISQTASDRRALIPNESKNESHYQVQ